MDLFCIEKGGNGEYVFQGGRGLKSKLCHPK